MNPPPLSEVAAEAGTRAPSAATATRLAAALEKALGAPQVSTVEAARRAASTDYAHLSPVLTAALPNRPADILAYPRDLAELRTAVALAHDHDVPIVARGKGTGNYGQAVPLAAGLVIDMTRMDRILEVGNGRVLAQAGATFVALEAAARRSGQEVAMMPTTVGSTIGGFLGGGAGGLGSIEHGWLWDGFTLALDLITCPPGAEALTVHGGQCLPYLHAYGVNGIIAAATVRLAPARERIAFIASFTEYEHAVQSGLSLLQTDPAPYLLSIDDPSLVALYPPEPFLPASRYNLRAAIDASTVSTARRIAAGHGGRIELVSAQAISYISTLAFNHVTLRAKRSNPKLCHLQVAGEALVSQPDLVREALPGSMLHLDGLRTHIDTEQPTRGRGFGGLLLSEFHDTAALYNGIARLRELGLHVVDPHTWLLDGPRLPTIAATAATNDPKRLLNPGKLPIGH